jgi:hypothetical protein
MYTFPRAARRLSNTILSLSQYVRYWFVIWNLVLDLASNDCPSNYNLLRWLLQGSSHPEQVVKPACADGTAVMWE